MNGDIQSADRPTWGKKKGEKRNKGDHSDAASFVAFLPRFPDICKKTKTTIEKKSRRVVSAR